MAEIQDSIVIDKEVETVRKAFLDFPAYSTWKSPFMESIIITTPDKASDDLIVEGDTLEVKIVLPTSQKENVFYAVVLENSKECFLWKGKLIFDSVFSGKHKFEFIPIENGTKTTFIQSEKFSGLMAWPLFKYMGEDTEKGFCQFNQKFKEHVERL